MESIDVEKDDGISIGNNTTKPRHPSDTTTNTHSIEASSLNILALPTTPDSRTICLGRSNSAAEAATHTEQSMTLREGLRLYPKAITWSILLSMTLVMEGYSTILVPNLFAMGPFRKQFGTIQLNGEYEINANWQSGLVNGAAGGQILGLFLAGTLSERIGYRRTLMVGLALMSLFVLVPFFANNKVLLLVGQCLLGAPWGVFQCISTVYAADVCPVALRAYLTTYVNACWVLGQLCASIVLRVMLSNSTTWSYRIPFALQWAFPFPILFFVYLAPESPWWLVRQNRIAEAKQMLRRLRTKATAQPDEEFDRSLNGTIETMVQTNENERRLQSGTRYMDCLRGVDRRRTEIACVCWIIQTLCGSTFMGFSTYFYEQAGLGADCAFTLSLAQFALGLIGVVISWALMTYFGRRTLYISGQVVTFLCVLLIGILACVPPSPRPTSPYVSRAAHFSSPSQTNVHPTALNWTIAALLLFFTLTYDATIGPICYSLVSEIPSTRLRSKTIVLARNCYNISGIITNLISPRMLNPTSWNWGARSGFFWTGTAVVGIVWSWIRLPEPKGRTFAELDELFERGVPARRFKDTLLDGGDERRDE